MLLHVLPNDIRPLVPDAEMLLSSGANLRIANVPAAYQAKLSGTAPTARLTTGMAQSPGTRASSTAAAELPVVNPDIAIVGEPGQPVSE